MLVVLSTCVYKDRCVTESINIAVYTDTVAPLNKGPFGEDINLANLFFVERFSSLGGSKCIVGTILGS